MKMKEPKVQKLSTNKLNEKFYVLHEAILSDNNCNEHIKDSSKELFDIFKLKEKEDKGGTIFALIVASIALIFLIYFIVNIYVTDNNNIKSVEDVNMVAKVDSLENHNKKRKEDFQSYLIRKNDSLYSELSKERNKQYDLSEELYRYKTFSEMATDQYGIKFVFTESKKTRSFSLEAPKLDSALVLLGAYRNKVSKKGNNWYVK